MPTLEKLQENRLIAVVESGNSLIGYRYLGVLYDIYEALDATLLKIMAHHVPPTPHSCTTLIGMERLLLSLLTQIDDPVLLLSHLRNVLADDRGDVDEQEDSRVALV